MQNRRSSYYLTYGSQRRRMFGCAGDRLRVMTYVSKRRFPLAPSTLQAPDKGAQYHHQDIAKYRLYTNRMSITLKPLMLAGGRSTRMKSPKHLLKLPDGTPLYQHQRDILRQACPDAPVVYMSLAQDSPVDEYFLNSALSGIHIVYDEEANDTTQSAGPAQGLLAAHRSDPTATWLVMAVDYPLMSVEAIRQLCRSYIYPVTCFQNDDGFCEPLVGIWSPDALHKLQANVRNGRGSPSAVVRDLGGLQIRCPEYGRRWLMNVNTEGEWEEALRQLALVSSQVSQGTHHLPVHDES